MTTFASFTLNSQLNAALEAGKFVTPTPVQAQAVPPALEGHDVLACAPTGTGKTAAFVLPALHRILSGPSKINNRGPRVLVLTPTRELAQQVLDNVRVFSRQARVRTGVIVGGVGYGPQYQMLRDNLDLLVATPGRLIDHLGEGRVDFSRIEMVILDEADKMLDMGFLKPVERILEAMGKAAARPQMMLFSATFTASVDKFSRQVLHNPVRVELAPQKVDHSQIAQRAYRADDSAHKHALLLKLLKEDGVANAIVFSATKHGADKLAKKLEDSGYASAALHGGMRQNVRKRTLDQMHRGQVKILVATDVAARGIDVKQLSHVINFDLPQVAEDYVHRIGRTGRAGETGIAISLVSPSDVPMLKDIEKVLGRRIELAHMDGMEPKMAQDEFARQGAAAPRSRQGMNRGQGGGQGRPQGSRDSRFGAPRGRSEGSRDGGRDGARSGGERSFSPRGERSERSFDGPRGERDSRGAGGRDGARDGQRDSRGGARPAGRGGERPAGGPRRERSFGPGTQVSERPRRID